MSSRTMAAVAVLALAPIMPGILQAEAQSFTAPSDVTIAYNATVGNFHGRVSSERTLCVGDRSVNVYKAVPGTNRLIGTTASGPQGGWALPGSHAKGTFYAVVLRSVSGGSGNSHVCLAARSPNLKV